MFIHPSPYFLKKYIVLILNYVWESATVGTAEQNDIEMSAATG